MKKLLIVNGPNLNLLGSREPQLYGKKSFDEVVTSLQDKFPEHTIDYVQSNNECQLIETLHSASQENYVGIALNAGAFTHTSIALADAIRGISVPVIEVHISNVFARETYRHRSVLSAACVGSICGLGVNGYELALRYLLSI